MQKLATKLLLTSWGQLSDEDLLAKVYGARAGVDAFGKSTVESGSLIQEWVQGRTVVEYDHYPPDDVVDEASGYQFYYHAHRDNSEHGHLHLFWHARKDGRRHRVAIGTRRWVSSAPTHLFSVSLDARGLPTGLFTVNRWVTEGHWFDANRTLEFVRRFKVRDDGAYTNSCRWLNEFVGMYLPVVEDLLVRRDARLAKCPDPQKGLDDRRLEVLSVAPIDWSADLDALEELLRRRRDGYQHATGATTSSTFQKEFS